MCESERECIEVEAIYSDRYKTSGKIYSQAERRNKFLNEVKTRRGDAVDEVRGITDVFKTEDEYQEELMDVACQRVNRKRNYGRQIMLSEWFADIPADLEENWYFKLCPVGVRNIVVAHNGITTVFNRHNQKKAHFTSNIPGGGAVTSGRVSILDCIFHHNESIYYILDLLVWNSCALIKCSAEFRFYFLKTKLDENPNLQSDSGKFRFIAINYLPAELPLIEQEFSHSCVINGTDLPVDGVLFYHKEADYSPGLTPLVGWLKPYMLPEMLQIPVHSDFFKSKPKNYVSLEHYLKSARAKEQRKRTRADKSYVMDATEDVNEIVLMES